ncbi:ATP-dependent DNA helicase [Trichonephila clavipes]|nr:ATP-dependent DNA helicase [Trichonephila clavipes]
MERLDFLEEKYLAKNTELAKEPSKLHELVGNISLDMNASHGKGFSIFQPINKYPDEKYRELVQKCNLKQRDLVQHFQSCLRREPAKRFHWMIQAAAGT